MKDTMKNILLILLITTASFLEGCDERITPNNNLNNGGNSAKTALLISQPWQYNEIKISGGISTKTQFSRPNSINLSSEFSTVKTTYNANGTYTSESKSGTINGQWQFLSNATQIAFTDANGKQNIYDISVLSKEKFDYTLTIKKSDVGNEALWITTLTSYGLPSTTTEIVETFSTIPY